MRFIRPIIALTSLCLLCGCASQPRLTITSDSGARYAQAFKQAYFSRDSAGDYRILLLNDGLTDNPSPGPLEPTPTPPIRQVVRIRLFWRPMLGTKPDFPSAANAAIDWYVTGVGSRQSVDVIHYTGVGFASVQSASDGIAVTLSNTRLHPVACLGDMKDPLGDPRLSGTFFALGDPQRVESIWDRTLRSARLAADRAARGTDASAAIR